MLQSKIIHLPGLQKCSTLGGFFLFMPVLLIHKDIANFLEKTFIIPRANRLAQMQGIAN